MALGHAVLAALLEGEASGYELSKRFDVSVANFWSATPQQLYRELDRLERDGLVAARLVEQERRPNKRVFQLTPAGRERLHEFTRRPARPLAVRDELVVKVQAVDAGDLDAVVVAVADRLEKARAKLRLYDRIHAELAGDRGEEEYLRDAERVGPYLTLLGGQMFEHQIVGWCERVLAALRDRQRRAEPRGASRRGS